VRGAWHTTAERKKKFNLFRAKLGLPELGAKSFYGHPLFPKVSKKAIPREPFSNPSGKAPRARDGFHDTHQTAQGSGKLPHTEADSGPYGSPDVWELGVVVPASFSSK
jgi:hypothetical protein